MDDEKFFAWLDGELDPIEAEAVAAAVVGDRTLTAKAEAHRAMQRRLTAAFEPLADVPAPGDRTDFAAARERKGGLPKASRWFAMAATLVIGFVGGTMIGRQPADRPDVVLASAPLEGVLQTQLASEPQGAARIGLTFRDRAGAFCRTFTTAGSQGLACRRNGDWEVLALVPAGEGQQGDIRMAAGSDPALAGIVDRTMVGEPFDAAQEKAARDAGWR